MASTVFVTAPRLAPAGMKLLEQAGCRVLLLDEARGATVQDIMGGEPVDAVISRTVTLSGDAIRACHTLKVISKHGVGVSNIDVASATARGIPVYVTPGANAQSVAELALGLMLSVARCIPSLDHDTRAGRWPRRQDGVQLAGRRLGLVGFGQVGQRLARAALAIGMQVQAFDPALRGASPVNGVQLCANLDELLSQSDVLSLHIPLLPATRGLIGARELALLPDGAILINTARGEVVDEAALVATLESGHLSGAGLDTMAEEPLPAGSALARLPKIVLTPHVGGSTDAALEAMAEGAARNVLDHLHGIAVAPSACVNPETLKSIN